MKRSPHKILYEHLQAVLKRQSVVPVEFHITDTMFRDLGPKAPISDRIRAMKELETIAIGSVILRQKDLELLWININDLMQADQPAELRHRTFQFFNLVIKHHCPKVDILRVEIFRFVTNEQHYNTDVAQRFDMLRYLTTTGKVLTHFEEFVGPFLLKWWPDIEKTDKLLEYLLMLRNIVAYNSPYLRKEDLMHLVQNVCKMCNPDTPYQAYAFCLEILASIIAYGSLPAPNFTLFVATLARTVTVPSYAGFAWKIMNNLLGTKLGERCFLIVCRLVDEPRLRLDAELLRGCVFFVHMALWDNYSKSNLVFSPLFVLSQLKRPLEYNHAIVNYEIALALKKLVLKSGDELLRPSWTIIWQIIDHLLHHTEGEGIPPRDDIALVVHDTLTCIEQLVENSKYLGCKNQFFDAMHKCLMSRSHANKMALVKLETRLMLTLDVVALGRKLNVFLERYLSAEMPIDVQFSAIDTLEEICSYIMDANPRITDVAMKFIEKIASNEDVMLRTRTVELVLKLSTYADLDHMMRLRLLDVLNTILERPYRVISPRVDSPASCFEDVVAVLSGLKHLFSRNIAHEPAAYVLRIVEMIHGFLNKHLKRIDFQNVFKHHNAPIILAFDFFMSMSANQTCQLVYPDTTCSEANKKIVSQLHITYLEPDNRPPEDELTSTEYGKLSTDVSYICLGPLMETLCTTVISEIDWEVLTYLYEKLRLLLTNKPLMLGRHGNDKLNLLCYKLCDSLTNKTHNLPGILNQKVAYIEFQTRVVSVLASFPCYQSVMNMDIQTKFIDTLLVCTPLNPRYAKQTLNVLTACVTEMRSVMKKKIPEILLQLTKISATKFVAMPVLELLSTLSQVPSIYDNFIMDQYMSVFAVALPYTNPFRFDHYVVSLAYHAICAWFLKCKKSYRDVFVRFILSGLQSNVIEPFKEFRKCQENLSAQNEDSSNRKRSSSLTEAGSSKLYAKHKQAKIEVEKEFLDRHPFARDQNILKFYEELIETFGDFLARYTYSPCCVLAERFHCTEFLITNGLTKTWILDNRLITVTTSGHSRAMTEHGVCEQCWAHMKSLGKNGEAETSRDTMYSGDGTPTGVNYEPGERLCACWCDGWAEIIIRRATGKISWVLKTQNEIVHKNCILNFPQDEVDEMLLSKYSPKQTPHRPSPTRKISSLPTTPTRHSLSRQGSQDSAEESREWGYHGDTSRTMTPRVRRSLSTPDMSMCTSPYLYSKLDRNVKTYSPVRGSCAAIPEELHAYSTSPPQKGRMQTPSPQRAGPSTSTSSYPASPQRAGPSTSTPPYPLSPQRAGLSTSTSSHGPAPPPLPEHLRQHFPKTAPSANERQDSSFTSPSRIGLAIGSTPGGVANFSLGSAKSVTPKSEERMGSARYGTVRDAVGRALGYHDRRRPIRIQRHIGGFRYPSDEDMRNSVFIDHRAKDNMVEEMCCAQDPSALFLHLYHNSSIGGDRTEIPLLVYPDSDIHNSIGLLDDMYPYETHAIGVVRVLPGQSDSQSDILRNLHTTDRRYNRFLDDLGTMFELEMINPHDIFLGGLDTAGEDGKYVYIHRSDLQVMTFHVATLMPNKDTDLSGNLKKRHIGNDNVLIVYSESDDDFDIQTISTQVTLGYIIVYPLNSDFNKVVIKTKPELHDIIGDRAPIIATSEHVSTLVRQMALHLNLASTVLNSLRAHARTPYASNWLERFRKIKSLRDRALKEAEERKDTTEIRRRLIVPDFSEYTWFDVPRPYNIEVIRVVKS